MRFFFAGLAGFSIIGLSFIATTIFMNKKLQGHPQPMIAIMCVVEACMAYNALIQVIGPPYFACYFYLNKFMAIFYPNKTRDDCLEIMCISN
jgi:hypothetical protein